MGYSRPCNFHAILRAAKHLKPNERLAAIMKPWRGSGKYRPTIWLTPMIIEVDAEENFVRVVKHRAAAGSFPSTGIEPCIDDCADCERWQEARPNLSGYYVNDAQSGIANLWRAGCREELEALKKMLDERLEAPYVPKEGKR